jgi:hypothetical protein
VREFIFYSPLQYGDGDLRIQFWVKDLGIKEKVSAYNDKNLTNECN